VGAKENGGGAAGAQWPVEAANWAVKGSQTASLAGSRRPSAGELRLKCDAPRGQACRQACQAHSSPSSHAPLSRGLRCSSCGASWRRAATSEGGRWTGLSPLWWSCLLNWNEEKAARRAQAGPLPAGQEVKQSCRRPRSSLVAGRASVRPTWLQTGDDLDGPATGQRRPLGAGQLHQHNGQSGKKRALGRRLGSANARWPSLAFGPLHLALLLLACLIGTIAANEQPATVSPTRPSWQDTSLATGELVGRSQRPRWPWSAAADSWPVGPDNGPADNLWVLCNSRCKCVILATRLDERRAGGRQQEAPAAPKQPEEAAAKEAGAKNSTMAEEEEQRQAGGGGGRIPAAQLDDEEQQRQQLIAFSSDYSLDYEHETPTFSPNSNSNSNNNNSNNTGNKSNNSNSNNSNNNNNNNNGNNNKPNLPAGNGDDSDAGRALANAWAASLGGLHTSGGGGSMSSSSTVGLPPSSPKPVPSSDSSSRPSSGLTSEASSSVNASTSPNTVTERPASPSSPLGAPQTGSGQAPPQSDDAPTGRAITSRSAGSLEAGAPTSASVAARHTTILPSDQSSGEEGKNIAAGIMNEVTTGLQTTSKGPPVSQATEQRALQNKSQRLASTQSVGPSSQSAASQQENPSQIGAAKKSWAQEASRKTQRPSQMAATTTTGWQVRSSQRPEVAPRQSLGGGAAAGGWSSGQLRSLPFGLGAGEPTVPPGGAGGAPAGSQRALQQAYYTNNPAKLMLRKVAQQHSPVQEQAFQQQSFFKVDDQMDFKVAPATARGRHLDEAAHTQLGPPNYEAPLSLVVGGFLGGDKIEQIFPLNELDFSDGKLNEPPACASLAAGQPVRATSCDENANVTSTLASNTSSPDDSSPSSSPASLPNCASNEKPNTPAQVQVARVAEMLLELETSEQESLNLRNNNIQFEQWTELYALLAMRPMHKHLLSLDLSHNSLVKLGVTFTGYIEHHLLLAKYLLAQHQTVLNGTHSLGPQNGSEAADYIEWPFHAQQSAPISALQAPQTASQQASSSSTNSSLSAAPMAQYQQQQQQLFHQQGLASSLQHGGQRTMRLVASFRHQPVLGDGQLFNGVQAKLRAKGKWLMFGSLALHNETAPNSQSATSATATATATAATAPQQTPTATVHSALASLASGQHPLLQLRALDLSHNKLKWLINDQFRAIKGVQSIRLDHNKIKFIHQQAFNGLESLRYLNLNSNRLQTIYLEQFQTNQNLLVSVFYLFTKI